VITAVDSSVLLDVLSGDARFGDASGGALRKAMMAGSLVACEVVWAETTAWFAATAGPTVVEQMRIAYDPMRAATAELAGRAWHSYRSAGGPRQRMIGDFLVGAHATLQADRLLTRDRGFYRHYFAELIVIDPSLAIS